MAVLRGHQYVAFPDGYHLGVGVGVDDEILMLRHVSADDLLPQHTVEDYGVLVEEGVHHEHGQVAVGVAVVGLFPLVVLQRRGLELTQREIDPGRVLRYHGLVLHRSVGTDTGEVLIAVKFGHPFGVFDDDVAPTVDQMVVQVEVGRSDAHRHQQVFLVVDGQLAVGEMADAEEGAVAVVVILQGGQDVALAPRVAV